MDIREYGGYIKLYRSLKLWEWYKNPATLTLWINLLLSVNREETRYMGKVIPAGSIVTSYRKLSEETGLSVKAVRVALKHLKETNEVAHQTASKYSVITIVKWADFQASESDMGTVKGTMKGKQRASRGQAEGKQRASSYIQESKNIRNREGKKILNEGIKNKHGAEESPPLPPQDIAERINSKLREMNQLLEVRHAEYDSEIQA